MMHEKTDTFVIRVLKAEDNSTFFPLMLRSGMRNLTRISDATAIGMAYNNNAFLQSPMYPIIGEPNTVMIGGMAKSLDIASARFSCGSSSPTRATDIG
jgi:hypothetical protein